MIQCGSLSTETQCISKQAIPMMVDELMFVKVLTNPREAANLAEMEDPRDELHNSLVGMDGRWVGWWRANKKWRRWWWRIVMKIRGFGCQSHFHSSTLLTCLLCCCSQQIGPPYILYIRMHVHAILTLSGLTPSSSSSTDGWSITDWVRRDKQWECMDGFSIPVHQSQSIEKHSTSHHIAVCSSKVSSWLCDTHTNAIYMIHRCVNNNTVSYAVWVTIP